MKASCTKVLGGFLGAGPVGSGALRASSINGSVSMFCGSGLRFGLDVRSTPGFLLRLGFLLFFMIIIKPYGSN